MTFWNVWSRVVGIFPFEGWRNAPPTNISHDDDSLRNFIHQLEENAVTQPSLIRLIEENCAGRIRPSNCRGRFNEWKYVKRIIQQNALEKKCYYGKNTWNTRCWTTHSRGKMDTRRFLSKVKAIVSRINNRIGLIVGWIEAR